MKFLPIFRMIVCSDVHYKYGVNTEVERFENGMKYAYSYAESTSYKNIDAFFAVGDFANSGTREEMLMFKNSLNKCIKSETDVTLTLASHEFKSDCQEAAVTRFTEIFNQPTDVHKRIKDMSFIALSTECGCAIKEKKQNWLISQLKIASQYDRKKPIFVFQHPHLSNTVYGSINWGEDDIISILMNYPQIIDFSGHSHAPVNDPRSVHQKYFSSFGTGSFSYFELDEFDKIYGTVPPDAKNCAQFLIVEVDSQNAVRVLPFDVLSNSFFNDGVIISQPWNTDSFVYTDSRYNNPEKPYFDKGSFVDVKKADGGVNISFCAAHGIKERINSYTVVIRRQSDATLAKQLNITSSYYLKKMPENYSVFVPFDENGCFTAEVTANGFWHNSSEKTVKEFNF